MSYILDALRRADAEREREKGAVPGLHARPLGVTAAEPAAAPARPQGLWLALGVSIGLLAALLWWVLGRPAPVAAPAPVVQVLPVPVPAIAPAAPAGPAGPAVASFPLPAPSGLPAAGALGQTQGAAALSSPPAAPPVAATRPAGAAPAAAPGGQGTFGAPAPVPASARPALPVRSAQAGAAPAPADAALPAAARDAGPGQAAAYAASAANSANGVNGVNGVNGAPPAPPAARALPLAQMSPDLRREMPAMSVGGSVYSESPGSRFVIINGQVVREGEGAATGVTVERIGPKSAVLRWRDLRIEVPL